MSNKVVKKGIVLANLLTLIKGGYLRSGQKVTSNDVANFDTLVKEGKIEVDKKSIEAYEAKVKADAEKILKAAEEQKAKIAKANDAVGLLKEATTKLETATKDLEAEKAKSAGLAAKLETATKDLEAAKKAVK